MELNPRAKQAAVLSCLVVAIAASGALLFAMASHLTFIADDWELLVGRRGWQLRGFVEPFNGNIVVAPALIYKLLQHSFGIETALPFYAISIPLALASAGLLFVYLSECVDPWLALLGAVSILFLGAAYEDFLWAFQMGYFGSMAAGLGMLVALRREDRQGDLAACGLLFVSLTFSSVGIAFAAGAVAEVALGRSPHTERLYIWLVPVSLFFLWWSGWGHTAPTYVTVDNLIHLPRYVFEAAAAGVTSLLGLASSDGSQRSQPYLIWGKLVVVVAIALLALRLAHLRRIPKGLAIVLAVGLAFWILSGLNRNSERFPTSSRYQYPSAVFLLLIAAEAWGEVEVPKLLLAAATVVVGFSLWGGISLLSLKYSDHWRPLSDSIRSSLAAVEIAGSAAKADLHLHFPPSVTVPASAYRSTARESGTPAFTESELEARPEAERAAADRSLAGALGLDLRPLGRPESAVGCRTLLATPAATATTLSHRNSVLFSEAQAPIKVLLNRFASKPAVSLGALAPGAGAALDIPADNSDRRWTIDLRGRGQVRLCATESGG